MNRANWKMSIAMVCVVGIMGVAIGHLSSASPDSVTKPAPVAAVPVVAENSKANTIPPTDVPKTTTKPATAPVANKLPTGSWTKEVEVPAYGNVSITWTFQDQKVLGKIEGAVMGVEFELATEAEISVSSHGTIYGVVTSARLSHFKLPAGEPFAEIKQFEGLYPLIEPFVNDVMTDLPFSYQFRISGDRLTILNYRILMSGPNPLGKLGILALAGSGLGEAAIPLVAVQSIGTALEGSYLSGDAVPAKRKGRK